MLAGLLALTQFRKSSGLFGGIKRYHYLLGILFLVAHGAVGGIFITQRNIAGRTKAEVIRELQSLTLRLALFGDGQFFDLRVTKAGNHMVVHHAGGLHMGVDDGAAHKFEAAFF